MIDAMPEGFELPLNAQQQSQLREAYHQEPPVRPVRIVEEILGGVTHTHVSPFVALPQYAGRFRKVVVDVRKITSVTEDFFVDEEGARRAVTVRLGEEEFRVMMPLESVLQLIEHVTFSLAAGRAVDLVADPASEF